MIVRRYAAIVLLLVLVISPVVSLAQQPAQPTQPAQAPAPDPNDPINRIKEEGMKRSQVMQTLSYLSDVIGPRLTASPGMKRANEWTRDQFRAWASRVAGISGYEVRFAPIGPEDAHHGSPTQMAIFTRKDGE